MKFKLCLPVMVATLSMAMYGIEPTKQSREVGISDFAAYFPIKINSKWLMTGVRTTLSGKVTGRYKLQCGISDIQKDGEKSVVSFFRIGIPAKYSNDGPEDYYINSDSIVDEDGCPLFKKNMKKGDAWSFPTSGKSLRLIEVVDIMHSCKAGNIDYQNCVTIKIVDHVGRRQRFLTFAHGVGIVLEKIYSGSTDISKARELFVETRN